MKFVRFPLRRGPIGPGIEADPAAMQQAKHQLNRPDLALPPTVHIVDSRHPIEPRLTFDALALAAVGAMASYNVVTSPPIVTNR